MNLVLPYLKAYAALVGSVATALLTVYVDNETLTVLAIIATTIGTWAVPNLDPEGEHQDESVQPANNAICEVCFGGGVVRQGSWDICPRGHKYVADGADGSDPEPPTPPRGGGFPLAG